MKYSVQPGHLKRTRQRDRWQTSPPCKKVAARQNDVADINGEYVPAPVPIRTERLVQPFHGVPRFQPRKIQSAFSDFTAKLKGKVNIGSLFAAPQDILFQGTFNAVKEKAQVERKWILVNILDNAEFAHICMNRDTWFVSLLCS